MNIEKVLKDVNIIFKMNVLYTPQADKRLTR